MNLDAVLALCPKALSATSQNEIILTWQDSSSSRVFVHFLLLLAATPKKKSKLRCMEQNILHR